MSGAVEPITMVTRWQMAEALVPEVLKLVSTIRERSLAEPGCLGFEVFRSVDDASTLLPLERYRDAAAIDAHRQSPRYLELVAGRIAPMLSHRQVELLRARSRYPENGYLKSRKAIG